MFRNFTPKINPLFSIKLIPIIMLTFAIINIYALNFTQKVLKNNYVDEKTLWTENLNSSFNSYDLLNYSEKNDKSRRFDILEKFSHKIPKYGRPTSQVFSYPKNKFSLTHLQSIVRVSSTMKI